MDKSIKLWNIYNGQEIGILEGHNVLIIIILLKIYIIYFLKK
jgi:hypothetical protein